MASNSKRPLRTTDAELDMLAAYGPADIQRAVDDWRANAPERAAGLVEATEATEDVTP